VRVDRRAGAAMLAPKHDTAAIVEKLFGRAGEHAFHAGLSAAGRPSAPAARACGSRWSWAHFPHV